MTSHFQDINRDVISRKKVLPPGECTRSVCSAPRSSARPFLIYSTFVIVNIIIAFIDVNFCSDLIVFYQVIL